MRPKRAVLLAACLLVTAPAFGAGMFGGPPEPGGEPTRFVKVQAVHLGAFPWARFTASGGGYLPVLSGRMAKITVVFNRFRFGASFIDSYGTFDDWSGDMKLPLHVGYSLFTVPKKTSFFWSVVPDVYLEASGSLLTTDIQVGSLACKLGPGVRVALCCDVDYYGLGTGLEVGWADIYRDFGRTPRTSFLYAGLQLRLLTFGIGI